MNNRQTISESKRVFHNSFPYVIPPIYRRVADELLVELNLLSHQEQFSPNILFALGLSEVFDCFTEGYEPKNHLKGLFEGLCTSCSFDPVSIKKEAKKLKDIAKTHSLVEVENWFITKGEIAPNEIREETKHFFEVKIQYSRLTSIGLLSLYLSTRDKEITKIDSIIELTKKTGELLKFSNTRIEKDLNNYKSNQQNLKQALELMRETIESEKKKKKKSIEKESNNEALNS